MIVMKFGGTSVENAQAIRRLIEIVRDRRSQKPVVVVSACAGATNDLLRVAHSAMNKSAEESFSILEKLRKRHLQIARELLGKKAYDAVGRSISGIIAELQNYVRGVQLLAELTPRSLDAFAGYGELLSSCIIAAAMNDSDMRAELLDAREVMITDHVFTSAQPIVPEIKKRAKKILSHLKAGKVVVTQGFIGCAEDGSTTTIGRGGSDLTASIFGSVLKAEEIQIWTDVDGMMSADPRIVPHARLIKSMSFNEASELAYFGAKVLHPRTILPAIEKNIPVRILNSRRPKISGTLIVQSPSARRRKDASLLKSIAFKKGITVITINSSRMLMAHGFLAKLFSIFAGHQKSVDVVTTSEVSVSLTVDAEAGLEEIMRELREIADVSVERKKAIICLVGEGMKHTPGIAGRIFQSIGKAGVNIEMVSEGASEINLTLVVDEKDVERTVRVLHDEFFD